MERVVLNFIKTQRVGVFAIRMPDGCPHGATMHFAHIEDPLTFIFLTSPTYKKVEALRQGESPASFVVGTNESVMKTLQMDGIAKLAERDMLRKTYFKKFPEKLHKHPEDVFFIFTPTWWRFTDWTTPEGKTILTSK